MSAINIRRSALDPNGRPTADQIGAALQAANANLTEFDQQVIDLTASLERLQSQITTTFSDGDDLPLQAAALRIRLDAAPEHRRQLVHAVNVASAAYWRVRVDAENAKLHEVRQATTTAKLALETAQQAVRDAEKAMQAANRDAEWQRSVTLAAEQAVIKFDQLVTNKG